MSKQADYLIEACPQIAITKTDYGTIEFNVAMIDDKFEHVEHISFSVPINSAKLLGEAILKTCGEEHGAR